MPKMTSFRLSVSWVSLGPEAVPSIVASAALMGDPLIYSMMDII